MVLDIFTSYTLFYIFELIIAEAKKSDMKDSETMPRTLSLSLSLSLSGVM
jgi:hypothetical protein